MSESKVLNNWLADVVNGKVAAVPETTSAIFTITDDGERMIEARNFLIATLAAHGKYAAAITANDPHITDEDAGKLGIKAAADYWHSLVSDVSKNLVEAWEAGRLR